MGSRCNTDLQFLPLPDFSLMCSASHRSGQWKQFAGQNNSRKKSAVLCCFRPEMCEIYPSGKWRQELTVSLMVSVWGMRGSPWTCPWMLWKVSIMFFVVVVRQKFPLLVILSAYHESCWSRWQQFTMSSVNWALQMTTPSGTSSHSKESLHQHFL